MNAALNRILVVGPAWVGDMVMAQSLFKTIKKQHPQASIDVVAPNWSKPLLARMPEVNMAFSLPVSHGKLQWRARWALGKQLRRNQYDQAIVIPRSYKAALVPWFAKVPIRTGYKGESRYGVINDMRALDKKLLTQTVQRYVTLGLPSTASLPPPIPEPGLTIDPNNGVHIVEKLGLKVDTTVIALLPGAEYGPSKRWPIERYRELADRLSAVGNQVWVFGSEKEQPIGEQIADGLSANVVSLCGRTTLEDVIDLLSLANVVVSNDSGLMHVAAAVDVNIVAIYGSTTPAYTPPLTPKARILYENLSCSPCFKRQCPLGHTMCLTNISVDRVMKVVSKLIANHQSEKKDR
ncbi:lipopolysaccharide heptosyltransferase II [Kaarinaea lacus]